MDGQGCDGDLAEIMARMAEGDDAAMVTLYERYRTPIAGAVQRELRHRGVRLGRDEVGGLVIDVCLELRSIAGAWSPEGGATPWVWARHRIGNLVDRVVGQHAAALDEARLAAVEAPEPAVGAADDRSLVDALARVAPDLESARLVAEALEAARLSPRDRELVLEYAYEKQAGNPAPATTVAAQFGMKEATVRQAFRRAVQRLRRLAAEDERFAPLAELPLLA
ncbi:MAG: sigma factor-like helix-turn-helix DNA-binding protein [Thermoanaerobacterales bacterium]